MSEDKKVNIVRPRLPEWIRVKTRLGQNRSEVGSLMKDLGLNTVCQSAKCPNLAECWHKKTATVMILGNTCTRGCKFCAVNTGKPDELDLDEPQNVADAVKKMGLKYAVITSVTRDDLEDEGANQFANVINKIREVNGNDVEVEVLTPDFNGKIDLLKIVLDAKPTIFNHNIETVKRLSKEVRYRATYENSMKVLKAASEMVNGEIGIKSGLMVGLGETDEEVFQTIDDLFANGVRMLTIGQYLPPSNTNWPLDRYVHPDTFDQWKEYAYKVGFTHVSSAPLVRSSYHAEDLKKSHK